MEINWNMYKPEQREEYLREIEDLVENSYQSLSPEQQKASAHFMSFIFHLFYVSFSFFEQY